jgi:hypothetical protein
MSGVTALAHLFLLLHFQSLNADFCFIPMNVKVTVLSKSLINGIFIHTHTHTHSLSLSLSPPVGFCHILASD